MKRRGFLFTTVLAASATTLAGSLLPLNYNDSEQTLSFESDIDVELYVAPLRAQRRSLLPDYPVGVEPGLLALMRTGGAGESAFSFATESALEARRVLYADIASLNPGFGRDPADGLRDLQIAAADPAAEWERDWFTVPKHIAGSPSTAGYGDRDHGSAGREWTRNPADNRSIRLLAQRVDSIHFGNLRRDTTSSVAQLAWTGELAGAGGPLITGGVFLGSETPKDRDLGIGWSGRQYYGLSLESRFTAFKKHTPFASLQIARSDYEGSEGGGATAFNPGVTAGYGYPGSSGSAAAAASRREDFSRLGAGWNWQIQPNWGLRAEAYYSLNSTSGVSAYDADRSQFFFSSRYEFR